MFRLLFDKFFTTRGRSSRKEYVTKVFIIFVIFIFAIYTKDYIDSRDDKLAIYSLFLIVILMYLAIIQYFPLCIRRLHDLNASGWYVLLTFVPFGQLLILWLMFKKGTESPNKYGPPPEY